MRRAARRALSTRSGLREASFYTAEAERRRYYYVVDLQGRLHLEDGVSPQNITTAIKDPRALRVIFRGLKRDDARSDYPYLSRCAGEYNFLRALDEPIVCVSFDDEKLLLNNFKKIENSLPNRYALGRTNGRLYYEITHDSYCLIKSSVAGEIFKQKIDDSRGGLSIEGQVLREREDR